MLGLIEKQARAGVEVRIIGKTERPLENVAVTKFHGRLHVRAIIQDGRRLFVGSQSLRRTELDKRREIGAVVSEASEVRKAMGVFEEDWAASQAAQGTGDMAGPFNPGRAAICRSSIGGTPSPGPPLSVRPRHGTPAPMRQPHGARNGPEEPTSAPTDRRTAWSGNRPASSAPRSGGERRGV